MATCKHCKREFDHGFQLGGHIIWCKLNPDLERTRLAHHNGNLGKHLSPEHKEKMRQIANRKIVEGTWHNSFSHARTHLYNGIKLYGKWELAYATWLDQQGIAWRRPKEIFPYVWNGSTHHYTPDFYLIDEETYVEVKGYETDRDRAKWSQFPSRLRVMTGEKLYKMGLISSYKNLKTSDNFSERAETSGDVGWL